MTKQLRAHFKSVLSLSIKKVCLRQYHFSMEGMRKGFLFCQRGWTLGASPPPPPPPPPPMASWKKDPWLAGMDVSVILACVAGV